MAAVLKSSSGSLKDVFQSNLQLYAAKQIGLRDCEENCLKACQIENIPDRQLLRRCASIVSHFKSVSNSDSLVYQRFTSSLAYAAEKRWLSCQARAFLVISSIADDDKRAELVKIWGREFFKGAKFINDCKNGPDISRIVFGELLDIQDAYQKAWWKERIHGIVQKFRTDPNSIGEEDWDVVEHGEEYLHKFWLDYRCRMPWIKDDLGLISNVVWGAWNKNPRPESPIH